MTLKGTIVLTATGRDDDSGKLDPAMAIVLESPACLATDPSSKSDSSQSIRGTILYQFRTLEDGSGIMLPLRDNGGRRGRGKRLPYAFDVESIKDTDDISECPG